MRSDPFKVEPGDPIMPAWNEVRRWVESLKVIRHPSIRVRRGPKGTHVTVLRDRGNWNHPFKVSAGDSISIRKGVIENRVPRIMDRRTRKLKRIDGRDDEGRQYELPSLEFDASRVDNAGYAVVALRILIKEGVLLEDEEAVTIVQISSIQEPPDDEAHYFALARLRVESGVPVESFQIVHHNLQLHMIREDDESRPLFVAV